MKGKQTMLAPGTIVVLKERAKESPIKRWTKPKEGWVKLSVDGSYKEEDGSAGTGMILRDARGSIIFSACRSLESCEGALQEELCACLEGLELSLQHSHLRVIVESNCS
jgi:hypothetical protein